MSSIINQIHHEANPDEKSDLCGSTECIYNYSCKEVLKLDFELKFDIGISLEFEEMLVDGERISEDDAGSCYLPFFSQGEKELDWKIGAILMQKYYWVFDATPSTEYGQEYNRIGIGLEDHAKEDSIGIFDSIDFEFFEEYLLYVYVVIVILVLLVLGCCIFSCAQA